MSNKYKKFNVNAAKREDIDDDGEPIKGVPTKSIQRRGELLSSKKRPHGNVDNMDAPRKKFCSGDTNKQPYVIKKKYSEDVDTEEEKSKREQLRAKLAEEVKELPIFPLRKKLLEKVKSTDSLVIVGETGSGKTTQVPKLLYRAGINRKQCIAVTQPRRVAAMSLAKRVSEEIGCKVGTKVGYNVRFEKKVREGGDDDDDDTKIILMTDGMLLRESLLDPLLSKYSVVILDEAHERTIETDVLFGIVKASQKHRREKQLMPLKVLVMSATMDVEKFATYFDASVFVVPGRKHRIDIIYKQTKGYILACIEKILEINKAAPANEDILVFLTGKDEIESSAKELRSRHMWQDSSLPRLVILPFYSSLPQDLQELVFQSLPEGSRKVIMSTNLAETSLTIKGIKFVVDSGATKMMTYDPKLGLDRLKVEPISKAQANQRSGRAGRESAGVCYRMYSEDCYDKFREVTPPEILRRSLESVILQLMYIGIKDVSTFDFMDKPPLNSIKVAVRMLKSLGAVVVDPEIQLTEEGEKMTAFPVDPKYSKIILSAVQNKCLVEVLTIIAVLSGGPVFLDVPGKRKEMRAVRENFEDVSGDLMTYLNIFRQFNKCKALEKESWCDSNYLNYKSLKYAVQVKEQLKEICATSGLKMTSAGGANDCSRRIGLSFCSGLFMNIASKHEGGYRMINSHKKVALHPSSILCEYHKPIVLFCELVETNEVFMRSACQVELDWIKKASPTGFEINL